MWAKALLTATGHIPPGYNSGTGGADTFASTRLGFGLAESVKMIADELPSYLDFEAWVMSTGQAISPENIERYNVDAAVRDKPVEMAEEIRTRVGLDAPDLRRTLVLNDLEDWHDLHASVAPIASHKTPKAR
jgi:hypothetical protein